MRKKNQVNALVKILTSPSRPSPTFIGYTVAYGELSAGAETLAQKNGYELVKFFFLLTFAAAIPRHRLGRHRRARALRPAADAATAVIVGLICPCSSRAPGARALRHPGASSRPPASEFHDFAGSVVVHAVGGWIGLAAVLLLGARATATARTAR